MSGALGVIPVRYGSTRFPGKPLAPILGRPMVQWVWEGACGARLLDRVVVATDDERILSAARAFGADAVLTSPYHASGTDRVAEVAARGDHPVVLNIQGDEPLVDGPMLDGLVEALLDPTIPMGTLVYRSADLSLLADPHVVKAVADANGLALYFSRSPIPHGADDYVLRHIGVYAYRREFLLKFRSLPASRLEAAEKLEQLRALESGHRIRLVEVGQPALSVDTPADIIKVEDILRGRGHG